MTQTRTFRTALVGLCRGCDAYVEPYEKGAVCPDTCKRPAARSADQWLRTMDKRVLIICEACLLGYRTKSGAEAHECGVAGHDLTPLNYGTS